MIVQFFKGRADILIRDGSVDVDCAVALGATVMAEVLSGEKCSQGPRGFAWCLGPDVR